MLFCIIQKKGVLHIGKRYLPLVLRNAIDLSLAKKILSEEEDSGTSLEYFSHNMLEPSLSSDEALKSKFAMTQLLEKKGLFTRILLREVRLLGKKLYPEESSEEVISETESFFEFLEPFAKHTGEVDDISNWEFVHNNIRLGIVYVARQETIQREGLEPYRNRIDQKIRRGCNKIYLFGRGRNNLEAVRALARIVSNGNPNIKVKEEAYFDAKWGRRRDAICCVLFVDEDPA